MKIISYFTLGVSLTLLVLCFFWIEELNFKNLVSYGFGGIIATQVSAVAYQMGRDDDAV